MVHLPALPGRCGYDGNGGIRKIIESVSQDLKSLQNNGIDGVIFCNEGDLPYLLKVGLEQATTMAAVIGEIRHLIKVPFGVNLLFDAEATLAVAMSVQARFVREVFTGVYESDMGWMQPAPGKLFDYREQIGANHIAIFNNICPEFAKSPGDRSIQDRAKIAEFFHSDAILVSGLAAGTSVSIRDLKEAKLSVNHTPIIANTGVRMGNLDEVMGIADGMIIGTEFKRDGNTWNPVDPERVRKLVVRAAEIRSRLSND
jgi:membrane complex biogenesis BtpA family protein